MGFFNVNSRRGVELKPKTFQENILKMLDQFQIGETIIICSDKKYLYLQSTLLTLKGTVSVISSDPPCKDGNAQFTTGTLNS